MEILLWLLLLARFFLRLAPYILGVAGGLVVIHFAGPYIPSGYAPFVFLPVAAGLSYGLRSLLSGKWADSTDNVRRNRYDHF